MKHKRGLVNKSLSICLTFNLSNSIGALTTLLHLPSPNLMVTNP